MVYRGGLEGVVNGLPKPTMGLLGTQIVYEASLLCYLRGVMDSGSGSSWGGL